MRFLILCQNHGTEEWRVVDVANRRLRKWLKVLKLLLHVFRNQAPVMVHHLVHFFVLNFCFSCRDNQVIYEVYKSLFLLTLTHMCNGIVFI